MNQAAQGGVITAGWMAQAAPAPRRTASALAAVGLTAVLAALQPLAAHAQSAADEIRARDARGDIAWSTAAHESGGLNERSGVAVLRHESSMLKAATPVYVTSLADYGTGSLRQVLGQVNLDCYFGYGPFDIFVPPGTLVVDGANGDLPTVACAQTRIIGATGSNGLPAVFIDGNNSSYFGLRFDFFLASGSSVSNVAVGNFRFAGIQMDSPYGLIENVHVGVQADGETPAPNQPFGDGVVLRSGTVLSGSVIAGNGGFGVDVRGGEVQILDSVIGLTRSGAELGNGGPGIGASGEGALFATIIRGNVIGSNDGPGIDASFSEGVTIQGNRIGVNAAGNPRGNNDSGVRADGAAGLLVGGESAGDGNVIAHNALCGVTATFGEDEGESVRVQRNAIFSNGASTASPAKGIARAECFSEVTAPPPDSLPKALPSPSPGITEVRFVGSTSGTGTTVANWAGTALGTGASVEVEVFANTQAPFDQGESYAGGCIATVAGTNQEGSCPATLAGIVPNLTTTVTRAAASGFFNTSEFSAPVVSPTADFLSRSFPNTTVGTQSSALRVTLSNPTANDTYSVVSVTPSSGDFTLAAPVTATCVGGATTVSGGGNCVIDIVFSPASTGAKSGTVTAVLQRSGLTLTYEIAVVGSGDAPNAIGISVGATPPSAIIGNTVRLSYAFSNPNGAPFVAGSPFVATLPTGLAIGTPANAVLTAGCGSVTTAASAVSVSALLIPTGGACELGVDVVGTLVGTYALDVPAGAVSGTILEAPATSLASAPFSLTINAVPVPVLSVLPPGPLAFGEVQLGSESARVAVTLANVGSAPLAFETGGIAITGDFRIVASNCGTGLGVPPDASAECELEIAFAPTALGTRAGQLTIASNGGSATVSLAGTGVAAPVPDVSVSPTALEFSPQLVGSSSAPESIVVSSTGTAPLLVTGIVVRGDFTATSNCTAGPVAPGSACQVDVSFAPITIGTRVGDVTVATNDPDTPLATVALAGEGFAAPSPQVNLAPPVLVFPDTVAGSVFGPLSATLSNTGDAPLAITAIETVGTAFQVANDCLPKLLPGDSCTLRVTFAPATAGEFFGDARIVSNGPGGTTLLPFFGRGVARPVARLVATPPSLSFGEQVVGASPAPPALLTVRNAGTAAATVLGVELAGDYAASGSCGRIDPGSSCSLAVQFTPTDSGSRPGSLTVTSDAEPPTLVVPLSGIGVALPAPKLELSASSIGFGNTLVGTQAESVVTVRNAGTLGLTLGALTVTGDYRAAGNCAGTLSPGQSCTINIAFAPRLAGARAGSLTIASNDPKSPATVSLAGTGCRFALTGRSFALVCSP